MALQIPFANTGDRKPISQGQSADGSVSWEKGFTSLYALAPQDGGKFIDRQEFNQIVYEISEATIENSQATAELIDDENVSTAKTWSSNKVSTELGKKGGFNKLVKLTTSGNFTAPITGWYKITCVGGGGGGAGSTNQMASHMFAGGGGGEGGKSIGFQQLTANQSYSYSIGAGGNGGTAGFYSGFKGGDTIFNGVETITAGGGGGGSAYGYGGLGGDGSFLNGACGSFGADVQVVSGEAIGNCYGGSGGGSGGGACILTPERGTAGKANTGGGGAGGAIGGLSAIKTQYPGFAGGSGVIFIEYFDESEE